MNNVKKVLAAFIVALVCSLVTPEMIPVVNSVTTVEAAKVKLSQSKMTVFKGDVYQLKVKGTSSIVKWKSSKKSIATIDSTGNISGKKPGKTTITAKVNGKTYKCEVTVPKEYLNTYKISLEKGKSYTLKVMGSKSKQTWKSSKASVASVNSQGKVVANEVGESTISVKVNGKSIKCAIVVTNKDNSESKKDVPISSLSLDKTNLVLKIGESNTVQAGITPNNTTEDKKIEWSTNNSSVATVNNGTINAVGEGSAIVTAKVGSHTASCTVTVNKIDVQSIKIVYRTDEITTMKREIGYSAYLDVNIYPSNATNKNIVWTSSNKMVADFNPKSPNTIVPLALGKTILTATVDGKTATCELSVTMPVEFAYTTDERGIDLKIDNKGKYNLEVSRVTELSYSGSKYTLYRGYSYPGTAVKIYEGGQFVYRTPYTYNSETDNTVGKGQKASKGYTIASPKLEYTELSFNSASEVEFNFYYGNTTYYAKLTSTGDIAYGIVDSTPLW